MLLPLLGASEYGSPNFECRTLTSAGERVVTRKQLLNGIDAVFAPGADVAFFHFAGHGFLRAPTSFLSPETASRRTREWPRRGALRLRHRRPRARWAVTRDSLARKGGAESA